MKGLGRTLFWVVLVGAAAFLGRRSIATFFRQVNLAWQTGKWTPEARIAAVFAAVFVIVLLWSLLSPLLGGKRHGKYVKKLPATERDLLSALYSAASALPPADAKLRANLSAARLFNFGAIWFACTVTYPEGGDPRNQFVRCLVELKGGKTYLSGGMAIHGIGQVSVADWKVIRRKIAWSLGVPSDKFRGCRTFDAMAERYFAD